MHSNNLGKSNTLYCGSYLEGSLMARISLLVLNLQFLYVHVFIVNSDQTEVAETRQSHHPYWLIAHFVWVSGSLV